MRTQYNTTQYTINVSTNKSAISKVKDTDHTQRKMKFIWLEHLFDMNTTFKFIQADDFNFVYGR